ncbi:MAG: hypothetical protein R2788_17510 [Saprospiraceae bacterium]
MQLEHTFPDYFSKYSLVTFNENMPYSEAMKRGRKQDELLKKKFVKDQVLGVCRLSKYLMKSKARFSADNN